MLKKIINHLRNRNIPADLRRDLSEPRTWKGRFEKRAANREEFQRQVGKAIGIDHQDVVAPVGFVFENLAGSSKDDGRVIEGWKRGPDGEITTFRHSRLTDGPWPPKRDAKIDEFFSDPQSDKWDDDENLVQPSETVLLRTYWEEIVQLRDDMNNMRSRLESAEYVLRNTIDDKRLLLENQKLFSPEEWEARASQGKLINDNDEDFLRVPHVTLQSLISTYWDRKQRGIDEDSYIFQSGPYMVIVNDERAQVLRDVLAGKGGIERKATFDELNAEERKEYADMRALVERVEGSAKPAIQKASEGFEARRAAATSEAG